jgi:hypothetical protein
MPFSGEPTFKWGHATQAEKYRVVTISGSGEVSLATNSIAHHGIAIIDNDPELGEGARVLCAGLATAIAGDTITAGAAGNNLTWDSIGRVIPAETGNNTIGVAVVDGVVGQEIKVIIQPWHDPTQNS